MYILTEKERLSYWIYLYEKRVRLDKLRNFQFRVYLHSFNIYWWTSKLHFHQSLLNCPHKVCCLVDKKCKVIQKISSKNWFSSQTTCIHIFYRQCSRGRWKYLTSLSLLCRISPNLRQHIPWAYKSMVLNIYFSAATNLIMLQKTLWTPRFLRT